MIDPLHCFTFADVPRELRRSRPNEIAVVDGEVRLTWPQLDDRVNRLASALGDASVGPGDVVLWLGQNSFRVIEVLLAAAKLRAVCCIANWRSSAEEFRFVIEDAAAKVVISQEAEIGETIRAARSQLGSPSSAARWLRHDGDSDSDGDVDGDYEGFLSGGSTADPALAVDGSDPVLMLYTAAFSGSPSGALLSHDALLVQSLLMAQLQQIDGEYRYLNSGPMFHVATLMTTLATLLMGGRNVFTPRVDARELCRIIEAERCTGAFVMPPTMEQIVEVNAPDEQGRRPYDLSSLRTFPGRGPFHEMVTEDRSPWAQRPAGFGQTEVMGMLTFNAFGPGAVGNAGRQSPMVSLRIVDPDGQEVPIGETGEIVARGPQVMVGYHHRPEENARRQRDGWHHTGDLGRREADGSISFVGPKGRIIKSAAENIYPAEVEAAICAHDAVAEAAVIGVPDPVWGQSVRAVVVLRPEGTVSEEELIAFVVQRVASYKKPKSVVFRAEPLPRLGWPIDYDTLDATYGGGGYPGGG